MSKNLTTAFIVFMVAVAAVVIFLGFQKNHPPAETKGKIVVAASESAPATATKALKVEGLVVSLDKIEVQKTDGTWATVFTVPVQVDLMNLKQTDTVGLLGQGYVEPGTYNQIRIHVMNVMIKQTGTAAVAAQLPSNDLVITGKMVVAKEKTSVVTLDFQVDQSLHKTASGKFILTPVINLESRSNANVNFDPATSLVTVKSGQVEDTKHEGMDLDGNFKTDFVLDSKLEVVNGKVQAGVK